MQIINRFSKFTLCSLILYLCSCAQTGALAGDNESSAGDLRGINHTQSGINKFSVNGYGGVIGGNTCCIMIPDKWQPGMKARIEWEVDPNPDESLPAIGTDEYRKAYQRHAANYQLHNTTVDIPKYVQACALTVHFLPCNKVKVTNACAIYGQPDYPVKEPLNMPEPKSCPK
ncbi:DUF3304 domain-containing protein [Serratia sp. L9]|uniref:DUF3304 domain-containing protein n=1 Tax=Serratia sp. L9 TaxID=3423946 RepID=UPI003D6669C4